MNPALQIEALRAGYSAGVEALRGIQLEVGAGQRVALVGLNGSGKTTLLLAAAGLIPHSGSIHVAGEALTPASANRVRRQVGVVFSVPEDQLLFPQVLEDVAFGLVNRGVAIPEAKRRAEHALEQLDALELADRSPYELSHGERLRVALAGAIVTEPAILLLDEPTAGLDPPTKRRFGNLLTELPSAMLIATHDLEFARLCCHEFVLLERGRLRRRAPIADGLDALWAARS
jgi:cobalt/nickel transport system ATP-binding protein